MRSRVTDAFQENGFSVAHRDDLAPGADQPVREADTILLRRSRPLQVSMDGNESRQVWTTAATVDEALQQLSMADSAPAAASRASRLPLEGMALPVVSPKNVHLDDGGVMTERRLAAPTVAGLLASLGTPLQQADKVVPSPQTPVTEGMTVVV